MRFSDIGRLANKGRAWPSVLKRRATRTAIPVLAASIGLVGCTSPLNAPPSAYLVQGNYEDIASCLYRTIEDTHTFGRDIHLTHLSNPREIRVALSRSTSRNATSSLAWEVELLPQEGSRVRLLVRQASTLVEAQPFWSSVLEPMITRCAGSRPVPA